MDRELVEVLQTHNYKSLLSQQVTNKQIQKDFYRTI